MMKKYFTLLLMLVMAYSYAQLAAFTVTATKLNDETCPSNGAISWTTSGTTAGSTLTYSVTNAAGTVVATTSTNSFAGLVAGTYTVTATQTLGSQSNSAVSDNIIIANKKLPLIYTVSDVVNVTCSNNGGFTINVTSGSPSYTYQLLDSNLNILITQSSNIFNSLAPGTYYVRVIDQCGAGVVQQVTINDYSSPITDFIIYGYYINCNEVALYPQYISGNSNGILSYSVTYTDPDTGVQGIATGDSTNPPHIPYFANRAVSYSYTVTNQCGSSYTKTDNFYMASSGVYPQTYNASCGGQYERLDSYNTMAPNFISGVNFKVVFTSSPDGNPSHYNDNNYSDTHQIGSSTNPLPEGYYSYYLMDPCGNIIGADGFTIYKTQMSASIINIPECDPQYFTVQGNVSPGFSIQSVKITSGPAAFVSKFGALPYTLPTANIYGWYNDYFLINGLPAGQYTFEITNTCGDTPMTVTETYTPTVRTYTNPDITVLCTGQFKINNNNPNGGNPSGVNPWTIQKYNTSTGQWGSADGATQPLGTGQQPKANSAYYNQLINLGNGTFRIVQINTYPLLNNKIYYCDPIVLKQFEVGSSLSLDNAYAFQCADGSYDVAISASGSSQPYTYAIVSDGTSSATVIRDNGTAPIFHGVAAGSYYFRVMDACGNFVTRKLDMAQLGKPGVSIVTDCTTTPGTLKLVVNGVDYLKFEWRKTKDVNGNAIASPPVIATTSVLDLGSYDSADAGTYTVHMYTDPSSGYCIDNSVDMSLTVDALTAAHAGTGQNVNITYDGTTQSLNLFNYLTGPYDAFGTWTETTVPPSALLTGNNWNVGAAAPGTYTFKYTVAAPCGGATDTATVTINLSKLCYKLPATTGGAVLDTQFGVTAMGRAGVNADNWPMVRKGGWMAMEANTKGFVVNRVSFNASNQPVGIPAANYVAGMMVYDTTNKCLKIYNGTIWSCFTTQTCPN